MQTRDIVRVVLSGVSPGGRREHFSTVIALSSSSRAAGAHLEQAQFRAGVRGLAAPWEVLADYEITSIPIGHVASVQAPSGIAA